MLRAATAASLLTPTSPTQNPRLLLLLRPQRAPCRRSQPRRLLCLSDGAGPAIPSAAAAAEEITAGVESVGTGSSGVPALLGAYRAGLGDQAFFLLAFIAATTSMAFTGLVIAAVPTLYAMQRAATSLAKLADTAREELPSTMSAIRLSGMEISDLTLELSDLSQDIADGVNKSAQAVQAADAGIRQIGSLAHRRTMSLIQERANLPNISVKPVVAGAAKKTSHIVGQATKSIMNLISRGEHSSNDEEKEFDA